MRHLLDTRQVNNLEIFVGNMLQPPQDFALVVTGVSLPPLNQI
jgi:hypothetical protein